MTLAIEKLEAGCANPTSILAFLANSSPVQLAKDSFQVGESPRVVQKHFGLTIPCGSTPVQVMTAVEGSFAKFADFSWGPFSVAFSPPEGMRPGSMIPVSVSYFGFTQHMAVQVQSMSAETMTFRTLPGHHLLYPASITFAASAAAPGSINFNIDLSGNFNGWGNAIKYSVGAGIFENAQWGHFLGRVGGVAYGGSAKPSPSAATARALVSPVMISILGSILGFFICLACRLPWNFKAGIMDAGLVLVVSVSFAYAYLALTMGRSQTPSGTKWILWTAAGSVVVRHLLPLAFHPAN